MDLDTALSASIQAGNEASRVGGPDEAAYHYQQALELLADPRRCDQVEVDLVEARRQRRRGAQRPAATRERAVAVIAEQLDRLPVDAPARGGPRMLTTQAGILIMRRHRRGPGRDLRRGARAGSRTARAGCAPGCSTTHARVLAGMGRYDEAQIVGMDALTLAERLDLHRARLRGDHHAQRPEEGRAQGGAARGARRRGRPRRGGRRASHAELRARYLLGRSYEDWAEFDETEQWFRSAIDRAAGAGIPFAPYGFEARVAAGLDLRGAGRLGRGARADRRSPGQSPPPIPRAMLDLAAADASSRPAAPTSAAAAAQAAPVLGPRGRGGDPRGRARDGAGRAARATPPAPSQVYDDVVGVLGRIWHEWFSARIRLGAVAVGAVAQAMPTLSAAERAAYVVTGRPDPRRRAHRRSTATPTRPATGVRRVGPG